MSSAEDELTQEQRELRRLATDPRFLEEARHFAFRAARKYGFRGGEEEDVFQSAILRLLNSPRRSKLPPIKDLHAYSLTVVFNEARRLYYKKGGRPISYTHREQPQFVPLDDVNLVSADPGPLEEAQHTESVLLMREAMQSLSEVDRRILELWFKGYSPRDIAERMNSGRKEMSYVTVYKRLKQIERKLRDTIFG